MTFSVIDFSQRKKFCLKKHYRPKLISFLSLPAIILGIDNKLSIETSVCTIISFSIIKKHLIETLRWIYIKISARAPLAGECLQCCSKNKQKIYQAE